MHGLYCKLLQTEFCSADQENKASETFITIIISPFGSIEITPSSLFSTFSLFCFNTDPLNLFWSSLLETFWWLKQTYEFSRQYSECPSKLTNHRDIHDKAYCHFFVGMNFFLFGITAVARWWMQLWYHQHYCYCFHLSSSPLLSLSSSLLSPLSTSNIVYYHHWSPTLN